MHCQYQINLLSACSDRDKSALIQIMSCDFYMHEVTFCVFVVIDCVLMIPRDYLYI